jgi:hypothetical protein
LTLIVVLFLGDSLAHHVDTLHASHSASPRRNQNGRGFGWSTAPFVARDLRERPLRFSP